MRNWLSITQRPLLLVVIMIGGTPSVVSQPPAFRITVNSNQDGPIQPDQGLTLREAIEVANGTLSLDRLSPEERSQIQPLTTDAVSRIEFKLPSGQTTIRLVDLLPPLQRPGLVLDGTTQAGYVPGQSVIRELPMPIPIVTITPAENKTIFRGLTVTAPDVTIRGLSLYGFTSKHLSTASTPPADILIGHRLPPPDISKQETPANFSPFYADDVPPQNVVIEDNWLGIPPSKDGSVLPEVRSAFGVSVFNSVGTIVRHNWIANHDGSAIITSVQAENLQVIENAIVGNGLAGMPDAIRLEGNINQTQITGNLICANDGSGVYLFKPQGAATIQENQVVFNGRRLRRAAIYLMGNHHQVKSNQIRYQTGPGVAIAAYPLSSDNHIQANRFSDLEGLSIDLLTQQGVDVSDYQRADGPNPPLDGFHRRRETANSAINAPQFVSGEFFLLSNTAGRPSEPTTIPVQVFGKADPGTQIELYRVAAAQDGYGALNQAIATTSTDAQGHFQATLTGLRVGERISAIATDPLYGTSEPAYNAMIRSLDPNQAPPLQPQPSSSLPRCTTPVATTPPAPLPPTSVQIQVPKSIHFGLDQASISAASGRVLDRIVDVLKENPSILVDLEGHADPRAGDAYNLELAMRRARSARDYLLRRGIAPERMTIRSYGDRQRQSQGTSRVDYARDRRVDFIFRDVRGIEVILQEEDLQIESN